MDGLKKTTSLLLLLCLNIIIAVGSVKAQDTNSRVERAVIRNGDMTVHVSVPRGRTIEHAELHTSNGVIELSASPVPEQITVWLVIDQSEAMINAAPSIQSAITRFINGISEETPIGILQYSNSITEYIPTTNRSEISIWLGEYSGRANTPNCIHQAIATLNDKLQNTTDAYHILVIGGQPVRQAICEQTNATIPIPTDFIIVSDTVPAMYQDMRDMFGGRLLRANIQTISNRLDEVKSLWSNPVYALSGLADETPLSGTLKIRLSDNTNINLDVVFEEHDITIQKQITTLTSLNDPTAQQQAQIPAEPQTIVQPAAQEDAPQLQPEQPAPAYTSPTTLLIPHAAVKHVGTNMPAVPVASAMPIQPTEAQQPANDIAQAQPSTERTEDTTLRQSQQAAPDTAQQETQLPLNNPVLIAGGLAALIVAALVLILLRKRKSVQASESGQSYSASQPPYDMANETLIEHTIIEISPPEHDDPLDITEMLETQDADNNTPHNNEVDIFEVTEIITEEELRNSTKPQIVAYLCDTRSQQRYEIRRPFTLLGRKNECDIVIRDDQAISREHIRFVVTDDDEIEVIIHTANPILQNQTRLQDHAVLSIGDTIRLSPNTELSLTPVEQSEPL